MFFNSSCRSGLPEQFMEGAHLTKEEPVEQRFNPYAMNGGTVLGIAGEDFAVLAGDTRLSEGYSIHSRDSPKTKKLTSKCVLATAGFHGDALTLHKQISWRLTSYQHQHDKEASTTAISQMLSTMLYMKRFFPYYTNNILGGVDENGKGAVYSYDPVGSYEREEYRAGGSGASLLQPLLDSELGKKNKVGVEKKKLSKEEVIAIVKDAFAGCAERDIYTGDGVEIMIVTKDGVERQFYELRRD